MKKFLQISLPAFFLVLLIFYIFKGLGPKNYKHLNERQASENKESFDVATFASLPVLDGGRLKPWDSIARNSLLIIRGKESIRIEKNTITATEWLMDVLMNPEKADNYPIFRIDHTDVLGLFGWKQTDQKYFSIKELQEHFPKIDEQFKKVNPKVFASIFTLNSDDYEKFRDALSKLVLNDSSLIYEPEVSDALGFGFRCGFLGTLHMEVVRERLEREYDLDLISTAPSVEYEVLKTDGEILKCDNPSQLPTPNEIEEIREPIVNTTIISPNDYVGNIITLCTSKRGIQKDMKYLSLIHI